MKLHKINIRTATTFAIMAAVLGSAIPSVLPHNHASAEDADNIPAIWLQISPVSNRVTLTPGKELDYNFTVSNIGSESFSYHVYATPYSVTDEDYNINFKDDTNRTQVSRWIKFYQEDGTLSDTAQYTIGVGEKQTINYQISVPENVPEGGQYATIFAESDEVEGAMSGSGIKTVSRVGLIVYGRTEGETDDSAEITEYSVPTFMTKGSISALSKVKNVGNTDFEAQHEFTVKSLFGKELYSKSIIYNVLPDTERRINLEWDNTPMLGVFQVSYSVSALDQARSGTKIVVILPIYVIVLALVLLTFLIIWAIILIRKRRERRSRLLV